MLTGEGENREIEYTAYAKERIKVRTTNPLAPGFPSTEMNALKRLTSRHLAYCRELRCAEDSVSIERCDECEHHDKCDLFLLATSIHASIY